MMKFKCILCKKIFTIFQTERVDCSTPGCKLTHNVCHRCELALVRQAMSVVPIEEHEHWDALEGKR